MAAVDSQTIVSLEAQDIGFGATKDSSDVRVGVLKVTSEITDTSSEEFDALTYHPKGNGQRPVTGGVKASKHAKSDSKANKTTKSDSKKRDPPADQGKTAKTSSKKK